MLKSFVDTLFILLCGTMIILAMSVPLGSIEASPVQVGSGGLSEIRADQIQVVVVYTDRMDVTDQDTGATVHYASMAAALAALRSDRCILLVAGRPEVSHQLVMDCWDTCRQRGVTVRLGLAKRPDAGGN